MNAELSGSPFGQVLLHDVLAARGVTAVKCHQHIALEEKFPNSFRFTRKVPDQELIRVDNVTARDNDMALIPVPADSPRLRLLAEKHSAQHTTLHVQLRDVCGLVPGKEYEVMSVYPEKNGLVVGDLQTFLLSIGHPPFHGLAMEMLRKLAEPKVGAILLNSDHNTAYSRQFSDPNSHASQLVCRVVANARLTSTDIEELGDIAVRKDNFEFVRRLLEAVGRGKSGFAAKTKRTGDTPPTVSP